MAITFSGGIHVDGCKGTNTKAIENMPAPEFVALPLQQHIGAPVQAIVNKGDYVKMGQVIGRNDNALSCPVHASVSGIVERIETRNSYVGAGKTEFVVIKNDGEYTLCDSITPLEKKVTELTCDEVVHLVREAGISGMGGATFPAYAKIQSAVGKAREIIINCAECEPFITANHRLLLEQPMDVINGVKILLIALGLKKATFAIEDNKKNAAKVLEELCCDDEMFSVKLLKTKYPQGDERQIVYALNGVQIPTGKLPADVGCVIFNAETCAAIYHAVVDGMPLISRIVTIDGDCIKESKNLRIPLGTAYRDVIDYCGGVTEDLSKVINGGPMMGSAQWDLDATVTKGTSALLFFSAKYEKKAQPCCIHCGKCVSVCPMHLEPVYLALFAGAGELDKCLEYNLMSCMECGSCSFICPGNVPIVQYIREAKDKIKARPKK
ncbi:MAG: electron transport complex subunit RsxC [Clostridia bacterium]|nr:electron transport complex subunit RsxC [Clostridia bacterium]